MNDRLELLIKKIKYDKVSDYYKTIRYSILNNEKRFIITANPETLMISNKDDEMYSISISEYTEIVPDGIGVIKAARILGIDANERITGVDLTKFLLELSSEYNKNILVYGAKEEVLKQFNDVLEKKYQGINKRTLFNGYTSDENAVRKEIINGNYDVILIALGIPKQEKFINSFFHNINKGICVGIGGSIDVISGTKERAPEFFINHNIEWLYRIVKEPKRIKRFFSSNFLYVFNILKIKLRGGLNG